ncbi:hypothetical protein B0H67DRAFT_169921 [Lasiosphaeris hirsuta]|uniref:Uncharacterized protein n=1 Tax=Lasiosphaeris hirsuta TaxID=260670 RepID=A0AA40DY49_9PEZI|nr:hypothetical protein B0H67DRAFT_169921 [Lasiosphaeris hirsuta]
MTQDFHLGRLLCQDLSPKKSNCHQSFWVGKLLYSRPASKTKSHPSTPRNLHSHPERRAYFHNQSQSQHNHNSRPPSSGIYECHDHETQIIPKHTQYNMLPSPPSKKFICECDNVMKLCSSSASASLFASLVPYFPAAVTCIVCFPAFSVVFLCPAASPSNARTSPTLGIRNHTHGAQQRKRQLPSIISPFSAPHDLDIQSLLRLVAVAARVPIPRRAVAVGKGRGPATDAAAAAVGRLVAVCSPEG